MPAVATGETQASGGSDAAVGIAEPGIAIFFFREETRSYGLINAGWYLN